MKRTVHSWRVPFTSEGALITTAFGGYVNAANDVIWKDNFEFEDRLVFERFSRGRSKTQAIFKSEITGKTYPMFLINLSAVLYGGFMDGAYLDGTFTFVKYGCNYGIKLVEK